jgi:hypothetical protein
MLATALFRPSEFRFEAKGRGCPQGKAVKNPSTPCGTTVIFNAYACAVFGIPQALLGTANALAAACPCRKGPPNGPAGLRVSAIRHGVTGTKLKPVSGVIADDAPIGSGAAVCEGPGTGVEVAKGRGNDVDVSLAVPAAPPHPAKEKTMRDKQINEGIPEARNGDWRRIDYLSAIQREQVWGCEAQNYNQVHKNVYRFNR